MFPWMEFRVQNWQSSRSAIARVRSQDVALRPTGKIAGSSSGEPVVTQNPLSPHVTLPQPELGGQTLWDLSHSPL